MGQLEPLQFEPMSLDCLSDVLENERRSYSHPWSEGIFSDCISSGHECWIVIFEAKVIGHSVLSIAAGESHLQNVCIDPALQGQGFGRLLVEFMLLRARFHRVSQVFLEVRPSNLPAYKLYESMGFNEIGIRPRYYPVSGGREDAIIFAMELFYDD